MNGTDAADDLSAGAREDLAWFLNGENDTLEGSIGDDYAQGDGGNDVLNMREGNDIAIGGEGDDNIDSGIGFDLAFGGAGDDILDGNGGFDTLYGGDGNDTLLGGSGADVLYGGEGDDFLSGLSEFATIGGNATTIDGIDTLIGGGGNDTLLLGAGDHAYGGEGDDIFQLDHTHSELTNVTQINDYTSNDTIELQYEVVRDTAGNEIPPEVALSHNTANNTTEIRFNGVVVAEISDGQNLTLDQIRLVGV